MKNNTELPEGIHRGSNLRLIKTFDRLPLVIVALDIVGHGPVSFPVRGGDHQSKGWVDCGRHEIQVRLGPNRIVVTRHGTIFQRRDVHVRRTPSEVAS